ncbi:hypothetical protein BJF93_11135 [Xaviernesmea oryzae]|uniref:Alpha-L-rhamnosidase n=1 Tax=Xaviernesmea oryzae TaxID=464029 RepID=A0A1Q9AW16_9HYPH|nr:alpha-L-rhamnosidase C-terminal domain-containing protein [Xaviernesmea oryzae]OLP59625.1 hypothetical protein BJF93_11135 [Xaviernesmea oryzae]SEM24549.1 alpha-L-rhamnosidase [Xaviernesmea oryzae]
MLHILSGRAPRLRGGVAATALMVSAALGGAHAQEVAPQTLVPAAADVCPTRVVSASSNISNANGLICDGTNGATFSVSSNSPATIVLDYGRNVGGIPFFKVGVVSGSIQLKASYSEARRYLSTNGDGAAPPAQSFGTGEGDPKRYDDYVIDKTGLVTNYYNQAGERYQMLTISGSGIVRLDGVGITYIADRKQPADYGGAFHSNDSVLNSVWAAGVYTAQLGSVPARSMPGNFRIVNSSLEARGASNLTGGSDIGYYTPGKDWTDYKLTLQANIVNSQAGWAVRTQDPQNGIVFLLDTSKQLRALSVINNVYKQIASATVPFNITAGTWYDVTTTVSGKTASVSINGVNVLNADISAFAKGSIGFREYSGETALFRNVVVSGGAQLNLAMNQASDLRQFWIPGSNEVAAIMDGAKRDRLIWSGDIDTAGPTIAYGLGNNDYLKGSLQQLALRQHTSGFVEGAVPATYPLIAGNNLTSETGVYSADYSMYVVLGAFDHLLFSGDLDFARSLWPVVQRQMAWNATRLDKRGLFITRKEDGADWDFYDPEKVGAITAYNAIYYRTLLSAAAIGDALGETTAAADYRSQADKLGKAINANMYNATKGYYKISDTVDIIAQDANAAALFAGLAPADQVQRILDSMKSALWTTKYGPLPFGNTWWKSIVSTFISGYEVQARYASNDTLNAEALIRNVYGWLVNPKNPDVSYTMWENIATDGTPGLGSYTSLAHGWATGAVSALSGYTLGIRPITPGFASWLVQPHPGSLTDVDGRVPTPNGPIAVKWSRTSGKFTLSFSAPSQTTGMVGAPLLDGTDVTVSLDGKVVWQKGVAVGVSNAVVSADGQFLYLSQLQGGTHSLEVVK